MNDYSATDVTADRAPVDLREPATTQAKVLCPTCGMSVHNNPAAVAYHAALHEPTAVHLAVLDG